VSWTKPSVETSTGTGTAEFESDQGSLTDLSAVDEATLPTEGKPNIVFPHGFFSFKITGLTPGAMVTVTITLPSDVAVGTEYWKYGPTLIDPTDHWYQLPMGSDDGDNVITITLVDGGLGDDDLTADGVIIDEGGPGKVPAPSTSAVGGIIISVSKLKLFGILLWVNAPITAALAVATASAILAVKKLKHRRGKARND